jgi:hypothetical protein
MSKQLNLGKVTISSNISITNVMHVRYLSFNFLSIAQLIDYGLVHYDYRTIQNDNWLLVFQGYRK